MNRALSAPVRLVGAALRATGAAFTAFGANVAKHLTLIPSYLSGLLWLLSQQFLDLARDGYGGNSAVYAVLRVLSTSVAEPPLVAYTVASDGETRTPLAYNHPLSQLIRRPNDLMTEFEFWELTTLYLGIGGRCLWFKERDNAGRLLNLWPLRPDRCGPVYSDGTQEGQQVIMGWSYLVPGTSHYAFVRRQDILAFNLPDPAGDSGGIVEGWSPLQALATEVSADNEASKYVGALLANSATPGIVLSTKNPLPNKEAAQVIKAGFVREFGGARRGLPAVIDAETTVTQLGFNMQQLEFTALRKVAESRIAAAFGVPAILAGLQVGLEAGIKATIAEQREYFTETTCAGYWRRYGDQYTNDIAAEYGAAIVCAFDLTKVRALMLQSMQQADRLQKAFMEGAVTVNEYRDSLGLPKLADGDILVLPSGAVMVDENGAITGPVLQQETTAEGELSPTGGTAPGAATTTKKQPTAAATQQQQSGQGEGEGD